MSRRKPAAIAERQLSTTSARFNSRRTPLRSFIVTLLVVSALVAPAAELPLTLAPGQSRKLPLPEGYRSHLFTAGGDSLLNVTVAERELTITALRAGETYLIVFNRSKKSTSTNVVITTTKKLVSAGPKTNAAATEAPRTSVEAAPAGPMKSPLEAAIERQIGLPEVTVQLDNGVFTLSGNVASAAQVRHAEETVQRLSRAPIVSHLQIGARASSPLVPPADPPASAPPSPTPTRPSRGLPGLPNEPANATSPAPTNPPSVPPTPTQPNLTPAVVEPAIAQPAPPAIMPRIRHTIPTPLGPPSVTMRPRPEGVVPQDEPRKTEIGVGYGVDGLSSNLRDWRSGFVDFNRQVGERKLLYGAFREYNRFGFGDEELMLGYHHPLGRRWQGSVEVSGSPSHLVAARTSEFAQLSTEAGNGWVFGLGYRRSDYDGARTNVGLGNVEKFIGPFRAGYTVIVSNLQGFGSTVAHQPQFDWFYSADNSIGISLAEGRGLESLGPPLRVVNTQIAEVALIGRHWFSPVWGITYSIAWRQQGDRYNRRGASLGVRYRF